MIYSQKRVFFFYKKVLRKVGVHKYGV